MPERDDPPPESPPREGADRIKFVDAACAAEAVGILREAAQWLIDRGLGHWSVDEFNRADFMAAAQAGELVMGFEGRLAAAVMLLQGLDPLYWPAEPPGAALYIHKLAVRRASAGRRWGHRMIEWAATQARMRGIPHLRLDTLPKSMLQSLYEQEGFVSVDRYPIRVGSAVLIRMERRL
jgi:GNAT superfamily N-acetyltransferase